MATQGHATDITLIAGADLSAKQFYAVKLNSSGQVIAAGAGEAAIGVVQNKPASGQAATVRVAGITKIVAGIAITAGAAVASGAAGKAKPAVAASTNTGDAGGATDALVGSYVLGFALEEATADGQLIGLLIDKLGAIAATAA